MRVFGLVIYSLVAYLCGSGGVLVGNLWFGAAIGPLNAMVVGGIAGTAVFGWVMYVEGAPLPCGPVPFLRLARYALLNVALGAGCITLAQMWLNGWMGMLNACSLGGFASAAVFGWILFLEGDQVAAELFAATAGAREDEFENVEDVGDEFIFTAHPGGNADDRRTPPPPVQPQKDYYSVLGIERTASEAEIKSAYHKLIRTCHPDLFPGDKEKEALAKEINEAYDVLLDPQKRSAYDRYGLV